MVSPVVCAGGATCLHGTCVAKATAGTSTSQVCVCDDLYSGSQCGYRNGLLYLELTLGVVVVFVCAIMALRVGDAAWSILRFRETKNDFFEFPRLFKPTERVRASLQPFIGTWEGPTRKHVPMKHGLATTVLVVLVVGFELLPFFQIAAIAFLPVVPWSRTSTNAAELFRLFLIYPLWSHLNAHEYPELVLYIAAALVPGMFILSCILGVKRFPLFKPQPKSAPAEDMCTLVLRALSQWTVIPLMIVLLMPFECLFVGYLREGSFIMLPTYDPVCFTWTRLGHASLGFAVVVLYSFLSAGIDIQLNAESSSPQPTLWTDARYLWITHTLHAPLGLSVAAFGNSNPIALCICVILAGLCLLVVNACIRPCIYSLINWMRLYGAAFASWSGLVGLVTSVIDDPWTKTPYDIWSLGAIALTTLTFSGLFVHYAEEMWLKLSLGALGKHWLSVNPIKSRLTQPEHPSLSLSVNSPPLASQPPHEVVPMNISKFKLPPLHVLKKRSRRTITADVDPSTHVNRA